MYAPSRAACCICGIVIPISGAIACVTTMCCTPPTGFLNVQYPSRLRNVQFERQLMLRNNVDHLQLLGATGRPWTRKQTGGFPCCTHLVSLSNVGIQTTFPSRPSWTPCARRRDSRHPVRLRSMPPKFRSRELPCGRCRPAPAVVRMIFRTSPRMPRCWRAAPGRWRRWTRHAVWIDVAWISITPLRSDWRARVHATNGTETIPDDSLDRETPRL